MDFEQPMRPPRFRSWAKPAISVAGAGIGAALAGPLGGAVGGWLGEAFGVSTSKLLKASTDKFGEQVIEKIADLSADSLVDRLKTPSIQLQGVYREALRQSLGQIRSEPEFVAFGEWFSNWERFLSTPEPLDLTAVSAKQLAPDNLNRLFRDTMVNLDAHGRALRENQLSLRRDLRIMPEALESALTARLPAILKRNFRILITSPEYEPAWKEANQLFEDAAHATLESIREATQRIDLRTREIIEDTSALRNLVAREPDAPVLTLKLVEPAVPWAIPPARDRGADVREALTTEGRRLGAPSEQWLYEALAGKRERLKNARKTLEKEVDPAQWELEWWSRHVGDPMNETERYALELVTWYTLAARSLLKKHDAQTAAARSVFLVFRVSNTGRIPAEKATIELSFPMDLSVGEYIAESENVPSPPEIPASLTNEIAASLTGVDLKPAAWYPGWERSKPAWRDVSDPELVRQKREETDAQLFRAYVPHLEHGSSKLTWPLRVNFKDRPAQSLRLLYTLHATNQPNDTSGEIHVEIVEAATPPLA